MRAAVRPRVLPVNQLTGGAESTEVKEQCNDSKNLREDSTLAVNLAKASHIKQRSIKATQASETAVAAQEAEKKEIIPPHRRVGVKAGVATHPATGR